MLLVAHYITDARQFNNSTFRDARQFNNSTFRDARQFKIFKIQKLGFQIHTRSERALKVPLYIGHWRVTYNYACSPFRRASCDFCTQFVPLNINLCLFYQNIFLRKSGLNVKLYKQKSVILNIVKQFRPNH